jgi:hypothetical protein
MMSAVQKIPSFSAVLWEITPWLVPSSELSSETGEIRSQSARVRLSARKVHNSRNVQMLAGHLVELSRVTLSVKNNAYFDPISISFRSLITTATVSFWKNVLVCLTS